MKKKSGLVNKNIAIEVRWSLIYLYLTISSLKWSQVVCEIRKMVAISDGILILRIEVSGLKKIHCMCI